MKNETEILLVISSDACFPLVILVQTSHTIHIFIKFVFARFQKNQILKPFKMLNCIPVLFKHSNMYLVHLAYPVGVVFQYLGK